MAHLVRQQVTYYVLKGRRVPKGTAGAKKVRVRSTKWYGAGIPGYPPKYRHPLCEDRTAARRMLDDLVRKAERGQHGVPDRDMARRPLSEHLKAFEADLKLGLAARGKRRRRAPAPQQVRLVVQRVRDVLDGCGWKHVPDLSARAAAELAAYLQGRVGKKRSKAEGGVSHQTASFILAAARRFVWWLSRIAPVPSDLFDHVPGFEPEANRVHARRAVTPEDLARVLDAALASAEVVFGLAGTDRYHLYLTAFATGYRAGELAALTPQQFALDSDPPAVHLAGKRTKAKRHATVPIPPAVAVQLKRYLEPRPVDRPVWPGKWHQKAAKMLRADLAAAGVPYRLDGPHGPAYADFHALRTSFVSALAAAGVGPKELQELARHADPRITLGVYAKVRPEQLGDAAARLPLPGQARPLSREELESLAAIALALAGLFTPPLTAIPCANADQPEPTVTFGLTELAREKARAKPGR